MLRFVLIDGRPGDTARYTASNASTGLPAAVLSDGGAECVGLLITIETNAIRFALNDVVPTSTLGHLLEAGDAYQLFGNDLAAGFHYINATPGSNGVLQITPFYT
jgi:hypothetical protein